MEKEILELIETIEIDISQSLFESRLFSPNEIEEIITYVREYISDICLLKMKDLDMIEYSNFEYFEV